MPEEVQRQEEAEGRLRSGGQEVKGVQPGLIRNSLLLPYFFPSFLSPRFHQGAILTTMLATRNFSGESEKFSHLIGEDNASASYWSGLGHLTKVRLMLLGLTFSLIYVSAVEG